MEESESCKLKYRSSKKKKRCSPYLVSFPNDQIFDPSKLKFSCYCPQSEKQKGEKLLVANTDRVDYVGTRTDTVAPGSSQGSKFYLGVLKKSTMRMKLYDTEMYDFKPLMASDENPSTEQKNEGNFQEKRKNLTSAFGSKVKKRVANSALQCQVDDSEINKTFTAAVSTTDNVGEEAYVSELLQCIPPQNRDATDKSEVYQLSDIITDEELDNLQPMALELQNANLEELDSWKELLSHYVLYNLRNNLPVISLHKCKLLVVYNHMVQYYKEHQKELAKKDPFAEFPESVKNLFFKHFVATSCAATGRQKIHLTSRVKDKLIAYALVIALFIEDFEVNISIIQHDFKLPVQRMKKMAHIIGCHVVKSKIESETICFAVLKIPLYCIKERGVKRDRWANKYAP